MLKDMLSHMLVYGTERVIQQQNGLLAVDGASKTDSLFLSTTQVYAPLSNLSLISGC